MSVYTDDTVCTIYTCSFGKTWHVSGQTFSDVTLHQTLQVSEQTLSNVTLYQTLHVRGLTLSNVRLCQTWKGLQVHCAAILCYLGQGRQIFWYLGSWACWPRAQEPVCERPVYTGHCTGWAGAVWAYLSCWQKQCLPEPGLKWILSSAVKWNAPKCSEVKCSEMMSSKVEWS